MKVAIVQPYSFPYIGYFQLIKAVDIFVFYDDVNFIKKGWINRNNLLINGMGNLFTIPLVKPSQNKLINEIELAIDEKWKLTFFKKIENSYKKAPYYHETLFLLKAIFNKDYSNIGDLAIQSIIQVSNYLELSTKFKKSSDCFPETKGLDRADRLIKITQELDGDEYINPIGGVELYNKEYFKKNRITLKFIKSKVEPYKQNQNDFVGGLSIIDVLMFNSPAEVNSLLKEYTLV